KTLKYTQPKECIDCPLAQEGICQRVFKMKITKELRKYTAPARGSKTRKNLYKKRTAVERVNGYLQEFYQLNNGRYHSGVRAMIHFDMFTFIYNSSKLAADRINKQLQDKTQVA